MSPHWIDIEIDVAEDVDPEDIKLLELTDSSLKKLGKLILKATNVEDNHSCLIKFISKAESQTLNNTYRGKNKPTNILSFTYDLPDFVESDFLGDLALCIDILQLEANEQHKTIKNHGLHLITHGILHLLGYDHIDEKQAKEMESLEITILSEIGIDDPYQVK